MQSVKLEQNIISIIKYGILLLIFLLSVFIIQIVIYQEKKDLDSNIHDMEKKYIQQNKKRIKDLVNRVYSSILIQKNNAKDSLRDELMEEVYQAHDLATKIYNVNKKASSIKIRKIIKNQLSSISFNNGNGHIFVGDTDGNVLLHNNKSVEGENYLDYKDVNGYFFVRNIIDKIKIKNEVFDEYFWFRGQNRVQSYKKIVFSKYFEPLKLIISASIFVEDYEKHVKEKIFKTINKVTFPRNEHIFIYDLNGFCLVNPKKELIGTNRYLEKAKNGVHSLKDTLEFAKKNKEGYLSYKAAVTLDKNLKSNEKISFVKYLKDWNLVVGSGFYLEAMHKEIEKRKNLMISSANEIIQNIIIFGVVISLIMMIFSFLISNFLEKIIKRYKEKIKKEMHYRLEKEKLLLQQSKMASMGEMIGHIAHQWKQPLSVISVSNNIMKLNHQLDDFGDKKEINNVLESIGNSVEHLSQTIDDFRNFFKPDKEKKIFKVEESFEKVFKLLSSQFENENIQILQDISDCYICGYPNEFLQVLINILNNAKDELVKIEDEDKIIYIKVSKSGDDIVIEIQDSAKGILESTITKVFDAYFSTKNDEVGTGIGLYMSKQIVENMNGNIKVSNESFTYNDKNYKGANFKIILPSS